MLVRCPQGNEMVTIAMDPGTKSAGFSIVSMNLDTKRFTVIDAKTVFGKDVIKRYGNLTEVHEERYLRNLGYFEVFEELLLEHSPFTVCSESPFMGKFAATFKALTEQITLVRAAISNWDRSQPLHLYSPSEVKKAVGVKGISGDKNLMAKALKQREDINWGDVDMDVLDEHSIDATCVAIAHLLSCYAWYKHQLNAFKGA